MSRAYRRGGSNGTLFVATLVAVAAVIGVACEFKVERTSEPPAAPVPDEPVAVAESAAPAPVEPEVVATTAVDAPARDAGSYFDRFKNVKLPTEIDPANPPEHLRLRLKDGQGKPVTLFLVKHSIRRDDYRVHVCNPGTKQIDVGPVRTYRGWCEELPGAMIAAMVQPDGTVLAYALRPTRAKGIRSGSGGPGPFAGNMPGGRSIGDGLILYIKKRGATEPMQDFEVLSTPPEFTHGRPYPGASFAESMPLFDDPAISRCTKIDQIFYTDAGYFTKRKDLDNPRGYMTVLLEFEFAALGFDIISLRDGGEAFRVSNSLLIRSGTSYKTFSRSLDKQFNTGPSDVVCKIRASGGGGAGGLSRLNQNSYYMSSINAMWHELGHKLNWGGDYQGGNIENGLLGGRVPGGGGKRFCTPARDNRRGKRKAMRTTPNSGVEWFPTPEFPMPPHVGIDTPEGGLNKMIVIDFLANDYDVNGDEIALLDFETTTTGGGTVTFMPRGGPEGRDALRYQPARDFIGKDRFSYAIVDTSGRVGYGNAMVGIKVEKRPLCHVTFDDADEYFEQDELKNEVKGVAASRIGWLTHKHRLTPHVAYWSVNRTLGRGGYFDAYGDPLYDLKLGQSKNEACQKKEFRFDISAQPLLNSPTGNYIVSLQRWGYSRFEKKWLIRGAHPSVTLHEIALVVDGKVVAKKVVNADVKLDMEKDGGVDAKHGAYRLRIDNLNAPAVRKALKVAAASSRLLLRLMNGKPNPKLQVPPGPKVELTVRISKTAGTFVGGLLLIPVATELESLKGKFGRCGIVHGYDHLKYSLARDGSDNLTQCVWVWSPSWSQPGMSFVIKAPGRHGIRVSRGEDGRLAMAYSNVHVGAQKASLFPLPPARKWFHLAIVYGDDAKVYINGELAAKTERTIFKTPPLGTLGNDFIGAYDDLRVYSGVLTQADIKGVMAGRHPRVVE